MFSEPLTSPPRGGSCTDGAESEGFDMVQMSDDDSREEVGVGRREMVVKDREKAGGT